jgi:hypothetical protein
MEPIVQIIVFSALVLGGYLFRRWRRVELPEAGALDGPIDIKELRKRPHAVERLAQKISMIGIIRNEDIAEERHESYYQFEAFAVDIEGIPHTFAAGNSYRHVAAKARWLAEQTGVRLDDAAQ